MTNNTTIDGVSRGLIEMTIDLLQDLRRGTAVERKLRALLDAPAVEQQEPAEKVDHPNFLEFATCDTCAAESMCCEIAPNEHLCGGCYWAPINEKAHADQVTALQSTIDRLEARITQLESEKEFSAATYQAARDRIAELESGMGEPIYELEYLGEGGGGWVETDKHQFDVTSKLKNFRTRIVFTAPPAPVAVVLPPFAEKVISKLRRCEECFSDFESGGVDIGRHWLDLLTQLGLLNRVQRSPAMWEITQQGEDCLDATAALNGPDK